MNDLSPFEQTPEQRSWVGRIIRFCLLNKLVVALCVLAVVAAGVLFAPFNWQFGGVMRYPVPVDAIPDTGENQQIVYTEWMGRTPKDVEDQITYPLMSALQGIKGVRTIRGLSMFGFSIIYVIFDDGVDFYWARARVNEKLNSLPAGALPDGVQPAMGPEATPLGQVFWYTLEGRDPHGRPAGGWDLEELRSIQDWDTRFQLLSAEGVAEVASVGGYVREYQVDADPDAMRAYGVTLTDVFKAVKASNIDVGAKVLELNRTEYFVRSVGFIRNVTDIENSVVAVHENVPVLIKHVATVTLGPAMRRGALNKEGAEAVGGVVVARYGANPLATIDSVKKVIADTEESRPSKAVIDFTKVSREEVVRFAEHRGFEAFVDGELNQAEWLKYLRSTPRVEIHPDAREEAVRFAEERGFEAFAGPKVNRTAWLTHIDANPHDPPPEGVSVVDAWPDWVTISKVTVVPFYDRTGLIYETLGTLNDAISLEILITAVVVIVMMLHLRSSLLIGGMLPLAVLLCFIGMKLFGVDANIVALSGIVIAIGTIVDMGIVICENTLRHLAQADAGEQPAAVIHRAASEVGGAVMTAVATTVISFLPVFAMSGAEGKMFKPLAYTKTFALLASIAVAILVIPPAAHVLFCGRISGRKLRSVLLGLLAAGAAALTVYGVAAGSLLIVASGLTVLLFAFHALFAGRIPPRLEKLAPIAATCIVVLLVGVLLTKQWEPLGPQRGFIRNFVFVGGLAGALLSFFELFRRVYCPILRWCLRHKMLFLSMPVLIVIGGATIWLGFDRAFSFVPAAGKVVGIKPQTTRSTTFWMGAEKKMPGLGKEFMPPLDEGSFLFMPTTMVHASIGECLDILAYQDIAFQAIPEIESVVGKIGRAETSLDPAPISMIETVINYKPEYATDKNGRRMKFRFNDSTGRFARDEGGQLIPDPKGRPYRQWRQHIKSPDDIWDEIVKAGETRATTSAPKLQPIITRMIMMQSGIRAPMGVKIKGDSLESIEQVGMEIERLLKEVPSVKPSTVVADRIVGKPYLEIHPNPEALSRYKVTIADFQDVVEIAIGGRKITTTVEGRRRFPVRVRYQRSLRDSIEQLGRVLVPTYDGTQIPLAQLAEILFVRGPQVIKSEDTFRVGYVVFDKQPGYAEVDVVEECKRYLQSKIEDNELIIPPGVSYSFTGNYENQLRAQKKLALILPLALFAIFMIIYFQFRSVVTTLLVFSGIFVAWAGGFWLIWLYGRPWFLDFSMFGVDMRELFQVHQINLSVAVWVGFLALFGIASDNGVIQSTYLDQVFRRQSPRSVDEIRQATVTAAHRRVRPCLMTSATTILALIPVLTSVGRGSDVMVPMAIPSFGGMLVVLVSIFVVPVLYCMVKERKLKVGKTD